ncbi:MAG: immunity 49 family protein [Flavobacteriales bacterium]|nr:immunity 49 family protein [Flavobacteriales bacterium]NQX96774.1 immunity 49 family protein [Flavobacteriales bacterium]
MIKQIELHKVGNPNPLLISYNWKMDEWDEYIKKAKENFRFLFFVYRNALEIIEMNRLFKNNLNEESKILTIGLNAISEVSRLAHFPGEVKKAKFDDSNSFEILIEDLDEIDDVWLNSFCLAIITRNQQQLKTICAFPIELLRLSNNTPAVQYRNLLIDLELIFFKTGIFDEQIYNRLTAIKNDNVKTLQIKPKVSDFHIIHICDPIIETMRCLSTNDLKGFNENLILSLQVHKAFWGQKRALNHGGTPLCRDHTGFISFRLTALAALAFDKGWQLDVESDYIPRYMVDGKL